MSYPWETPVPAVIEPPVEQTVAALQRDFAYAVTHTAILVHSPHDALKMLVNTPRGQVIPRGECKLSDGTVIEFQDVGMPQINAPLMTVQELVREVLDVVGNLGLGVKT